MLENPFALFPSNERIRRLYPRLEQAARNLEAHLRGYQTAGRAFQRVFLAMFPPCFEFEADAALAPLRQHFEEARAMISEADFPNAATNALDDNNQLALSICLSLTLLQREDARRDSSSPPQK